MKEEKVKNALQEYMDNCEKGQEVAVFYPDIQLYRVAKITRVMRSKRYKNPKYRLNDKRTYDNYGWHQDHKDYPSTVSHIATYIDKNVNPQKFTEQENPKKAIQRMKQEIRMLSNGRYNNEEIEEIISLLNKVDKKRKEREKRERIERWNM